MNNAIYSAAGISPPKAPQMREGTIGWRIMSVTDRLTSTRNTLKQIRLRISGTFPEEHPAGMVGTTAAGPPTVEIVTSQMESLGREIAELAEYLDNAI